MLFPHDVKIPDSLKGTDYFTTLSSGEGGTYWHNRELIRYKYGKSKKLDEALSFLESQLEQNFMNTFQDEITINERMRFKKFSLNLDF